MNRRILIAIAVAAGLILLSATLWAPPLFNPTSTATPSPTVPPPTATPVPPTSTPAPPTAHALRAQVHDAETGAPIAGAAVLLGDQRGASDDAGTYAASVAHGVTTPIEVQAPGYEPWRGAVDTTSLMDEGIDLEAPLTANTVRGQVVGMDLVPLPQATVTFRGQPVPLDGEARFTLRKALDRDPVTATHPGYVAGSAAVGSHLTLHLILEPIETRVHVRDDMRGMDLAGATVCALERCATTDDQGSVAMLGLPPGTEISVQRPGYRDAALTYEQDGELAIELGPAELHGTIRNVETGEPITRAIVLVGDQVIRPDENGMVHVPDMAQAESLFVKAPGYERMTFPLTPGLAVDEHDTLAVCEYDSLPCVDISLPTFAVRGIYASYNLLVWNPTHMLELIDLVDRSPTLNAIVVDVKGDFGYLAFQSDHPLIAEVNAMASPRLPVDEFLQICKEKGIYTIARMVVFKDTPLIEAHPELAVRHPDGEIFYDREGMAWVDPTKPESWEYTIAVTKEAIKLGFDEVQYDYVRFPSDSTSLEIVRALVYSVESTIETRTAAIQGFVKAAKAEVDRTRAFLSLDIFGYSLVIAPDHDMRIGQRLKDLAPYLDYVCPMIYPSTFQSGNLGLVSPSDSPYEVIQISMGLAAERTDTVTRPWLQGYWYERQDMEDQLRAAEEASDLGWCFWNARGEYDEVLFGASKGQ